MSDEQDISQQAKTAAMLAVMAAGRVDRGWRTRVNENIGRMAALVRDDYGYWGRDAQAVIDSDIFTATYLGHSLEESSKRLIVRLESKTADEGHEEIRTERTDNARGRIMQERIERLTPGQEIVVFKHVEHIGQNKKVRLLSHFEPRFMPNKPPEQGSSRPSVPAAQPGDDSPVRVDGPAGGEQPSPTPAGSPPVEPPPSDRAATIQMNMEGLSARQMLAVKNQCVGEGINDWTDPADDDFDRVLVIIQNIRKEQ